MLTSRHAQKSSVDAELREPLLVADSQSEGAASAPDLSELLYSAPKLELKAEERKREVLPLTTDAPPSMTLTPAGDDKKPESSSDEVKYLNAQISSFNEIKSSDWIVEAQTQPGFLNWVNENNEDWIRLPNAETDRDILLAVNGELPNRGTLRSLTVMGSILFSTPFTLGKYAYDSARTINPGEIHFTKNGGKQEIRVEPGIEYLASVRHSWGKKRSIAENFIKEENVTIVRIQSTQIGFAMDAGIPILLLPGRHAYNSANFHLEEKNIFDVNSPVLKFGSISIVRVYPDELGVARENGNTILLLPGLHIRNSVVFEYLAKFDSRNFREKIEVKKPEMKEEKPPIQGIYSNGALSLVRVDKDKLGSGMLGSEPVLLNSGIHLINNSSFKFANFFDANAPLIEFNTIHIIRVQRGQIGLALDYTTNKAVILEEGEHKFNSLAFKFKEFKKLSEKQIKFENYTRVQINAGEYGYAWDHGKAIELSDGIHESMDPLFNFVEIKKTSDPVIQFGNIAHVIVKAGEARPVWEAGKLKAYKEGVYHFNSNTLEIAAKSISLQAVIHTMHDIHVTTRDRMPMHVTGQVVYRVENPEKLIISLSQDEAKDLNQALEKRAAANLREQFSHVDLSMISPDHHQHDDEKKEEDSRLYGNKTKGEGNDSRGQLCTKVMEKLSTDADKWGIQIVDFEILDVGCQKKEVEDTLAEATAKTRQTEAKYELQKAENSTTMIKEKADGERELMREKKKAEISKIHTATERETTSLKIEQEAQAKAKAKQIETKAIVDSLLQQAKAEMEAAKFRAEGQEALNAAMIKLLNHPGYLELEKAKLQVQIEAHRSKRSTPSVVFNGDGSKSAADSMFFGEGTKLMQLALKQKGPYRTPPSSPVAVPEEAKRISNVPL